MAESNGSNEWEWDNKYDPKSGTGGGVSAPQILYSVTVTNPGQKPVKVSVEYTDSKGAKETETADLKAGESRYFGQRTKKEKYWTSSLVVSSIKVECEGKAYTMPSTEFGMHTTTEHLSFAVKGSGDKTDEALGLSG